MPRFLHAIPLAVCDRCGRKMPADQRVPDGNNPALLVHPGCRDDIDPYRLPARQLERIAVTNPRPDTKLTPPTGTTIGTTNGQGFTLTTENGDRIGKA